MPQMMPINWFMLFFFFIIIFILFNIMNYYIFIPKMLNFKVHKEKKNFIWKW